MRRIVPVLLTIALSSVMAQPITSASAAAHPPIKLTVTINNGEGVSKSWLLKCNPSTGSKHPNTRAACALLNKAGLTLFVPVPRDRACTMIYGGPERATVRGTWGTRKVSASFQRSNGCEIDRWNKAAVLFPRSAITPAPLPTVNPSSGTVTGRVSLAPTCPVQQQGQACEKPSVDALVTFTSGNIAIRALATADGGFSVTLPTGIWTATADAGMRCEAVSVTVPSSAPIVIRCDTGIR